MGGGAASDERDEMMEGTDELMEETDIDLGDDEGGDDDLEGA
jgi:hypothetical protein